jgi:ring-1,2-phenylacetyl-CoA epoxidase subunit PaaB
VTDTQWPRFEVFLQEEAGRPHQSVGTVHAPDAEMALQNARDVFVRRPVCASLWVAPAEAVYARTVQELEEHPLATGRQMGDARRYAVFQKSGQRRAMTYVTYLGEVEARGAEEAVIVASRTFPAERAFVWWVCPLDALVKSDPDDAESMFSPALSKRYRMPQEYRVLTEMINVRSAGREGEEDT